MSGMQLTLSYSEVCRNYYTHKTTLCFHFDIQNIAGPDDIDMEAYRHLEKAVERALLDLGRVPEGSSSQGRPTPAPSSTTLINKDSPRSYLSAVETPRNQAGSITEMLNNQEQILKMTPDQLEVVLRILQNILRQNARPPNNG